ncbi:MAG: ABC transporter ATP-binding protein [Leptospiraceae bacterium]|nr:ABC transporter ATP-binding protein [Leptospiraceae bacterium]
MKPILSVKNFYLEFLLNNKTLPILQDISFDIFEGEILALVGESGCGKSVTSLAITKLLPVNLANYRSGEILFRDKNILNCSEEELIGIRGKEIAYIFQDPFTSLNPIIKIKKQIIESYMIHISPNEREAIEKAEYLLQKVGITEVRERLESYPGQMSGGMLQRICIAMALMCDPKLLIADEPTSALDVTVQSQLVELLLNLKQELKMSILFISHDIGLVGYLADRIAVMYAGQIIEIGVKQNVILNPLHPYTQSLIASVPTVHISRDVPLKIISGIVPSPSEYPKGCHFSTRCEQVFEKCREKKPYLKQFEKQSVRCFLYD